MRTRCLFDILAVVLLMAAGSVLGPVRPASGPGRASIVWGSISRLMSGPHAARRRG
ncbi:MAG: hypothetical protein LAP40_20495 [Acidobacteriia bacterium]|nr:hypothetical protein [Terriglobia bacterium]